ncbi:MAG: sugar phosphorylase [Pseudomonadales bacterium]|jgi:sucrose phosphorylase|nr:sugar phosphorylase [Pseudomonadales bacterium]
MAVSSLRDRIILHLEVIYPDLDTSLADRLMQAMGYDGEQASPDPHLNRWDESDVITITYANSVTRDSETPLHTLQEFLDHHLHDTITDVHILPFFPYSSDDGFAVLNYRQVNGSMGEWEDIESIASRYRLMADLVVNHCSSRSEWFEQFKRNEAPGRDYFFTVPPDADVSEVVRPRTNPLLQAVETLDGTRHVWCTFSHDQVDLDFRNPELLLEMVEIIAFYLDRGVRVFRLDAIAFLWKVPGTSCLNLPETHEVVRLFRTLIEHREPDALIVTETNIPNRENLAYFGNANEAHIIYNFALPPLLLHAMVTGNNHYLRNWLMSMPPAQDGTTYLNFIASHDGIGLRPIEGILTEEETGQLLLTMQSFGGRVSWRNLNHDEVKPYEINISLFSAMQGTLQGPDEWQVERFVCAHTIMAALEGIPAFYIHSLTATENDQAKFEATGNNRAINRHVWDADVLDHVLADENTDSSRVMARLKSMLAIRKQQPAFHPNATQYTLHLGEGLFCFWRQSRRREQSIFCIHNITRHQVSFTLSDLNLVETNEWRDLFKGEVFEDFLQVVELAPYQCLWLTNR